MFHGGDGDGPDVGESSVFDGVLGLLPGHPVIDAPCGFFVHGVERVWGFDVVFECRHDEGVFAIFGDEVSAQEWRIIHALFEGFDVLC